MLVAWALTCWLVACSCEPFTASVLVAPRSPDATPKILFALPVMPAPLNRLSPPWI